MTGEIRVPVVALSGEAGTAADIAQAAADWYLAASRQRCRLVFPLLPAPSLPGPASYYTPFGGKGSRPRNSQSLAGEVVRSLEPRARDLLRSAGGRFLLIAARGMLPHTWHIPNGGVALGNGVWSRRYSVLPDGARLGAACHELGHLLFDWPDFIWEPQWEGECLMARGAGARGGCDPAPPCAPLLVKEGWRDVVEIPRELTVRNLGQDRIGQVNWGGWKMLVEWRRGGGPSRLLLYAGPGGDAGEAARPRARMTLSPEDEDRSLLGLLAPALRCL